MPRTPTAIAVRENLEAYVLSHQTSLKEVARKCDIGYSTLHRFMANDEANISSDTIDKIAAGLSLSPAWIVDSKPTVVDDVNLTPVTAINDLLLLWGKTLYAGQAGYEKMRPYLASGYFCTGFDPEVEPFNEMTLTRVASKRENGPDAWGISAQDEWKINYEVAEKTLFHPVSAKIISGNQILVSTVCYYYRDSGYTRYESASVLGLGHDIKDIVEAKITPTITHHNWVPGAGTVTYQHGSSTNVFDQAAPIR